MDRAPYPARIAAGLIVTALEETRKLPALLVTLPMTAVSQTLQAGMRAQQNIAELAIKGDAALGMLFDKPSEQPEWARFDEDDETPEPGYDAHAGDVPIEKPTSIVDEVEAAADGNDPGDQPGEAVKSTTASKVTNATKTSGAAKATKTSGATEVDAEASDADLAAPPRADAGRFALYSSAPEEVVDAAEKKPTAPKAKPKNGATPEIVVLIDYDTLTLAQLRARLRTVGTDDLETLVDYEKANRGRAPFVTMLENRIASQNKRSTEA
ncbi:lipid droplet-associated protein [Gordonia sp. C13]|uniref:lipid droplet-associated protein n=1 Tax=Gordonia sp. C13 TaxID=2935078 RepID=UPI0012B7849D|nr:lipid droplet-associated protein [Gordonia sp. C13]MCK8615922.1 lipid droplet-associated protein [Gordonia sp. C13]